MTADEKAALATLRDAKTAQERYSAIIAIGKKFMTNLAPEVAGYLHDPDPELRSAVGRPKPASSLDRPFEDGVDWNRLDAATPGFHDEAYLGGYDVRHSLFDVGARVRLHVGSTSVGAGAGVEIDDATAFADVPGYVNPLVLVTVDVKYEVERIERFGVVVEGSVSYATTLQTSTDVSMYGDAFCARLAIGLSL